jgi:hypothetical protein
MILMVRSCLRFIWGCLFRLTSAEDEEYAKTTNDKSDGAHWSTPVHYRMTSVLRVLAGDDFYNNFSLARTIKFTKIDALP